MKQLLMIILLSLSLLNSGCEDADVLRVADTGIDAITAVKLSDQVVRSLAREAAQRTILSA